MEKWAWYDKYALVMAAVLVYTAGYYGIPWAKIGIGDWPTWFGAIGTVGTLIGTIWLATRESIRRNRAEHAAAVIEAAAIHNKHANDQEAIRRAQAELKDLVESFETISPDFRRQLVQQIGQSLQYVEPWPVETMLRVAALDACAVAELSAVYAYLRSVRFELTLVGQERTRGNSEIVDALQGSERKLEAIHRTQKNFSTMLNRALSLKNRSNL